MMLSAASDINGWRGVARSEFTASGKTASRNKSIVQELRGESGQERQVGVHGGNALSTTYKRMGTSPREVGECRSRGSGLERVAHYSAICATSVGMGTKSHSHTLGAEPVGHNHPIAAHN